VSDYGTITSTFTTEDGHVRQHGKKLPGTCSVSQCCCRTSVIEDGKNYCGGHDPIVARRNAPHDIEEDFEPKTDWKSVAVELAAALKEVVAMGYEDDLNVWMRAEKALARFEKGVIET